MSNGGRSKIYDAIISIVNIMVCGIFGFVYDGEKLIGT